MSQALVTVPEFHALALGEEATSDLEDGVIEAAVLAASSLAYSFLRSRYTLPLVTWGSDLKMAVAKIAALYVLTKRGFDPSSPADQAMVKGHDDAIAWLRDVAADRAAADVVDTAPAARLAPRVISNVKRGW